MSAQPQIRVADIGTTIRLRVNDAGRVLDVSTASVMTIKLAKPSGVVIERAGTHTTDGVDGRIEYVTVAGDLDESGPWFGQAYLEFGAATKFHTTSFSFQVAANLN